MAVDSYESIWRSVLLRCPMAGPMLARQWVRDGFREVAERHRWSWLLKQGQFVTPQIVNAGTVTVTRNSANVVGVGTGWTSAIEGIQFRLGSLEPIYSIATFTDANNLVLDLPWGGTSQGGAGYTIFQAYYTVPSDFHAFVSVIDPQRNWQLWTQIHQEELDAWDSQRTSTGDVWVVANRDYDTSVTPPRPRYELWAHPRNLRVYPFLYERRADDLDDAGASLPLYIRGDVLREMALAECARWPGLEGRPNPYFDMVLYGSHRRHADDMIDGLLRQDDEVFNVSVYYQQFTGLPFASLPLGDSAFMQAHAV